MKNYIIAVSGSSGAGKSTMVETLEKLFQDSVTLYFDAYQETTIYPEDMMERLTKGERINLNEVKSEKLLSDLNKLKSGVKVTDPWGRILEPKKYIIIEEPFGKSRDHMAEMIDVLVFIDLPLDVALARRVLRDVQVEYKDLDSDQKLSIVEQFLTTYLAGIGHGYHLINQEVSKDADIIINGLNSIADNAKQVFEYVKNQEKK